MSVIGLSWIFSLQVLFASVALPNNGSHSYPVSIHDIQVLDGDWEGQLKYLDYSSEKTYEIPVKSRIEAGKSRTVKMAISYPDEPHANSREKLKLSKDGLSINGHDIIFHQLDGSTRTIGTVYEGKDNKETALIKETYVFNQNQLTITKEVQFLGSSEWIFRNAYELKR